MPSTVGHLMNGRPSNKMLCYVEMSRTVSQLFKNSQSNGEGGHVSQYLYCKLCLVYEAGRDLKDFEVSLCPMPHII